MKKMDDETKPRTYTGQQALTLARHGTPVRRTSWLEGVYVVQRGFALRYHNPDGTPLQVATFEDFNSGIDWIVCTQQNL